MDWLIARKKSQTLFDKSGSGKKPFHTGAHVRLMVRVQRGHEEEMHLCHTKVLKLSVMLMFLTCRWGHPDCRPAGSNRESCDTAAGDSFDGVKRAGPDIPAAWQLYHHTAKRTDSHVQHPHHSGQICAYIYTLYFIPRDLSINVEFGTCQGS